MAAGESASMDFSSSVAAEGSVVCVHSECEKNKYYDGVIVHGLIEYTCMVHVHIWNFGSQKFGWLEL